MGRYRDYIMIKLSDKFNIIFYHVMCRNINILVPSVFTVVIFFLLLLLSIVKNQNLCIINTPANRR